MKDTTNKKVLGKFKDEMNSLIIKEFTALNLKCYSIKHQHLDEKQVFHEDYNKKACKACRRLW